MKKTALLALIFAFASFAGSDAEAKKTAKTAKNTKKAGKEQKVEKYEVVMKTSAGDIVMKLFPDKAPKTVENFVGLANGSKAWKDPKTGKEVTGKSLYVGTIFHRIIPNFMVQGGDPLGNGSGGPGYAFEDEFHPSLRFDKPGLLAMANAGPRTNGSQFFITVVPTPWLNNRHTIFGEVTSGMDIVQKIVSAPRGPNDYPNSPVKVESITIQ